MLNKTVQDIQYALEKANDIEKEYYNLKALFLEAEGAFTKKKAKLFKQGKIYRKNKEEREAQVIYLAEDDYNFVKNTEGKLMLKEADYQSAIREWETIKIIMTYMIRKTI